MSKEDAELGHVGPVGERGVEGVPGSDHDPEADAAAKAAGDAFVDAIDNPTPSGKKWYDSPTIRNIKLGTIAAVLISAGAAFKGCLGEIPDADPSNPVVIPEEEEPQAESDLRAKAEADGWQRTETLATRLQPVFGIPPIAPGTRREWAALQGDTNWYFRDVPE